MHAAMHATARLAHALRAMCSSEMAKQARECGDGRRQSRIVRMEVDTKRRGIRRGRVIIRLGGTPILAVENLTLALYNT